MVRQTDTHILAHLLGGADLQEKRPQDPRNYGPEAIYGMLTRLIVHRIMEAMTPGLLRLLLLPKVHIYTPYSRLKIV